MQPASNKATANDAHSNFRRFTSNPPVLFCVSALDITTPALPSLPIHTIVQQLWVGVDVTMNKRRYLMIVLIAGFAAVVTGCLHTEVLMSFSPTQVRLSPGDEAITGTLSLKLIGYGLINIEGIFFSFLKEDGDAIIPPFKIELNSSLPVSATEEQIPITLPFGYDMAKGSGLKTIRLQITGQKPSVLDIPVVLVEEDGA